MMDYGMNRLRRLGGLNMLGEPAVNAAPTPDQNRPGYWWNDKRVAEDQPFNKRFAGGQLYSTFTPYSGDPLKYGMGPQHRYNQVDPASFGTNTATGTATTPTALDNGNLQQQQGGPDSGDVAERNPGHHGKSFDQMTPQELQAYAAGREKNSVLGMSLPSIIASALGMKGANFLEDSQLSAAMNAAGLGGMNPGDYVDGKVAGAANTGMNVAGGTPNPELAGRSDPSQSGPTVENGGNAGAWGGSGEKMAEGGIVEGDDQHGVDDVHGVSLDGGEGVIRADPMEKLGKPFLDALNKGDFEVAYDILGHIIGKTEEQEEAEEGAEEAGEMEGMEGRDAVEEDIARRLVTKAASPPAPPTA